jgi:hypothetical protein
MSEHVPSTLRFRPRLKGIAANVNDPAYERSGASHDVIALTTRRCRRRASIRLGRQRSSKRSFKLVRRKLTSVCRLRRHPGAPIRSWSPRLRCPGTWGCRSRADVNYSNSGLVNVASPSGMIDQRACSAAHRRSGRVPGASTISGSSSRALLHPSSGRAGQTPTMASGPWSDQQSCLEVHTMGWVRLLRRAKKNAYLHDATGR